MNAASQHRRYAPVGSLDELEPIEAGAVMYLRLWCDGPDAQAKVWNYMASSLGPKGGREALQAFEYLCNFCLRRSRRPLMRHQVNCKCIGADESWFADFIGYAAAGKLEDALFIATTIFPPDIAPVAVECAQHFGLALQEMNKTNPKLTYETPTIH